MSATIFPTGVTIYNPEKCWSGYTIFQAAERGALLIDMNGNEVRMWEGLQGFPNKMLPGGYVMGSLGERNPKYGLQDQTDLVQVDWDGNIVWKFDKAEYIEDPGEEPQWMARQHHDYQREGNTVGYYAPGMEPKTELVRGQVELADGGYIRAGEDTRTSLPLVYAAGDIRTKPLRQVVCAAADGAVAASMAALDLGA